MTWIFFLGRNRLWYNIYYLKITRVKIIPFKHFIEIIISNPYPKNWHNFR